jgi:hypothetical protein
VKFGAVKRRIKGGSRHSATTAKANSALENEKIRGTPPGERGNVEDK